MGTKWKLVVLWVWVVGMATVAQAGDPDLLAWWKLDDGVGTVALDSSGNENHGTLEGAVWVNDPGRGTVISFDGASAYVDTDLIIPAQTLNNSFSWVFWIKQPASQATNNDTIMGNRYGGTSSPLQFCKFTPTRFEAYNDDGAYVNGINYDPFPSDVWVHNAVVKNGAELTYYRDGVVTHTNTMTKTLDENPFYLGADGFSGAQEAWEGFMSDVRLYTRALSEAEVLAAMAGKPPISEAAADPIPETEAIDVRRDAILTWTSGKYAATHDVYLGTVADDVNSADRANPMGVLLSQGQADASFDPEGLLELGQTYYWRIDEVNAAPDNTIYKGEVWSFTAEPVAYPIEGVVATSNTTAQAGSELENIVNGSGLDEQGLHSTESTDMWLVTLTGEVPQLEFAFDRVYKLHEMVVWNYNVGFELILGFGAKDVTVEYSVDGAEWSTLGDVVFAQATAKSTYVANTMIDLQGVAAQYVRLTINSEYGVMGQLGLSEIRFMYIPAHAREPQPADGAVEVTPDAVLDWRPGREAAVHEVYFGTAPDALALVDSTGDVGAVPPALAYGDTYYWRVDEVNEADAIAVWEGSLWSFATQEFGLVDGFEDYDDEDNRIYDTWLDGFINDTGSTVGYLEAPFAEQNIVNSGRQSLPLEYDNEAAPYYSEISRTWSTAQDWTATGADTMRLFVQGDPNNAAETLYVALEDSSGQVAVVANDDPAIVQTTSWVEWQIPLADFAGVNTARIETVYIGVGDRDNPAAGGTGLIYIDDIGRGHPADVE